MHYLFSAKVKNIIFESDLRLPKYLNDKISNVGRTLQSLAKIHDLYKNKYDVKK